MTDFFLPIHLENCFWRAWIYECTKLILHLQCICDSVYSIDIAHVSGRIDLWRGKHNAILTAQEKRNLIIILDIWKDWRLVMSKSQKAISGYFTEVFGSTSQPVKTEGHLLRARLWYFLIWLLLTSLETPASWSWHWNGNNSSWREGDRIMILEVTYSKTVLWEKFPLTTFQQHSLAILKSAEFSVHKGT